MHTILTAAESLALLLSLQVAFVAVLGALPFAFAAAFLLARTRFPGKTLVDGFIHLPLALPPVAIGYLLLLTFGTRGPVGGWLLSTFGVRLVFSWTGAALASAIITFPFQVRSIRLALEAVDHSLNQAAETLGAGFFDRLINLTLPIALPGVVAGAITAFAACLGEFGAIITFVSNIPGETRTLPLAIYTALQTPDGGAEALRLSLLSILLALIGVTAAEYAARRARAYALK
jgi:molybdate transport system permease protein